MNKKEPVPAKGMPECPDWLLPEAKAEWERLCEKLSDMGVLTEIDMAAFAAYCQSFARWKEAQEDIDEEGSTFATDEGKYKRTWFEKLDYMPTLTEYQKKRFINLKRTGQWERLQANKIPRELRKTVVEALKTQNELIYMMQQGLASRGAVVKRKAYLILAKMKYQRPEEGSEAYKKIEEEIELCNGLLNDADVPEVGLGYWIGYGGELENAQWIAMIFYQTMY